MTGLYAFTGLLLVLAALGLIYYFVIYDRGSVFEHALVLAKEGNYVDARGIIRSRLSKDPDSIKGHFYLSRIYALEGNEDQELYHLNEIKKIGRYSAEVQMEQVLLRIAQIHYQQDNLGEAFENYLDALHNDPKNVHALVHIAFLAAGQESFDTAIKYFSKLTEIVTNKAEYFIGYGVCLAMMKKGKEAMMTMEQALNIEPDNQTAKFLLALLCFRQNQSQRAQELLSELTVELNDPMILYMARKMTVANNYMLKNFADGLQFAQLCLDDALKYSWTKEEYDSRLSVAYMAILAGDLEKANDQLLDLEIQNPADKTVLNMADFRMDLEEQVATVDQVSPRNFDFLAHMQDWVRSRFDTDFIYKISGLKQSIEFDVLEYFSTDGAAKKVKKDADFDPTEMIDQFNNLKGEAFRSACEKIIMSQGFKLKKELKKSDKDGLDFLAQSIEDKKVIALFRLRKWSNEPISDIFIRDQQNYMNEHKAQLGFIVAGAHLTPGAEAALKNLKKITVVNEVNLGNLLKTIL